MRPRGVLAALAAGLVLLAAWSALLPRGPGVFVLLLAAVGVGGRELFGAPTDALVDAPWRRLVGLRALARRTGTRRLGRELARAGADRGVRRPIRSRADVRAFRRAAVGALLGHAVALALHLLAALALAAAGRPGWALVAVGVGAVLHAWPALLQVEVLGRVDELRALVGARRRG